MITHANALKRFFVLGLIVVLLAGCQGQPSGEPSVTAEPTQEAAGQSASQFPLVSVATPTAAPQLETISTELLLDPALAQDADSLKISQYLYQGLVQLDDSGQPAAGLAESWVISDDQLDYIFTIRAGMTFSDGAPITPDVVVDNFNRWFDPENPLHGQGDYAVWQSVFLGFHGEKGADGLPKSPVDGIQKVDQNTVLVHLNRPMPELLTSLAQPAFAILNPQALSGGDYGGRASTIVSSGPYLVQAWTDKSLKLSPNPNYWGEAPQEGELEFGWRP